MDKKKRNRLYDAIRNNIDFKEPDFMKGKISKISKSNKWKRIEYELINLEGFKYGGVDSCKYFMMEMRSTGL